MEKYILTIDSAERDTSIYRSSNEYTVNLNTPLYNITKIDLVSARIPLSQYLIDVHNNTVVVDNVEYTITSGDYTGTELAAKLKSDLGTSVINNVQFNANTQKLEFKGTTQFQMSFGVTNSLAEVLGFLHGQVYTSTAGGDLESEGVVNLFWPNSIILSLKGNSEEYIDNKVYVETEHESINFYGVILSKTDNGSGNFINFDNSSDVVKRNFIEKTIPYMNKLTVQFLFNNFDSILPYDFKLRNHVLKFEITCSLDKLVVTKENENVKKMIELPPKLDLERFRDPWRPLGDRRVLMYGGAVILFIVVLLMVSSKHVQLRR